MQEFETKVNGLLVQLAALLVKHNWKMATAESCTGGWVAKCCTNLPGSSAWFDRGFVTYSNEAKQQMLGVSGEDLIVHGAVSMVEMALDKLSEKQVVTLDEERKAAMVSNLLVVLCSESSASPVVNTGTLYQ